MKRIALALLVFVQAAAQTVRFSNIIVNTNITASGMGIVGVPSFTPSLASLSSPAANQVFQRNTGTSGIVTVSGTASGPTRTVVEARAGTNAWQTVGVTDRNGQFTGSITAPVGSFTLQARVATGGATLSVTPVGVGDVFALWGQSNSSGRLSNNQTYSNSVMASVFANSYTWQTITDPTDSNSGQIDSISSDADSLGMGSVWPLVATQWASSTGIPIAFVPCSKGSTGFGASQPTWVPATNRFDRSTLFGSAMNRIRAVGGVRAILWWQGEGGFDDTTGNSYITPWLTMATNVQAEFPGLKLVPCKLQECVGVTNQRLTNGWWAVQRIWSEATNFSLVGPTLADAPPGAASNILTEDEGQPLPYFHLKSNSTGLSAATRWATNLIANFQSYP